MNDVGQTAAHQRYRDGHFLVTDGLRLHYRDYPGSSDKPPLLCLPGLTRNAKDFEAFGDIFSPGHRVLALEFRGRGESDYDPIPARYIPPTYAADVIQMLDELSIERAIFVGTSLGGLVTMAVGMLCLDRIAGAILNDIGPELTDAGLDRIKGYVGANPRFNSWDEAADRLALNNGYVPPAYTHADWVKMAHRVCREEYGHIRFDYDIAIAIPFETSGAAPTIDLWPLFETVGKKPLLVVRGELSDLLTAASLEKMQKAVPSMKSVTVPGVGHAPMLDEPAAVAAISAFLNSVAA
jgi:pimeloyl-ACP methyl ester carboxylesterase